MQGPFRLHKVKNVDCGTAMVSAYKFSHLLGNGETIAMSFMHETRTSQFVALQLFSGFYGGPIAYLFEPFLWTFHLRSHNCIVATKSAGHRWIIKLKKCRHPDKILPSPSAHRWDHFMVLHFFSPCILLIAPSPWLPLQHLEVGLDGQVARSWGHQRGGLAPDQVRLSPAAASEELAPEVGTLRLWGAGRGQHHVRERGWQWRPTCKAQMMPMRGCNGERKEASERICRGLIW